jgi:N-dimethylarginine dimethylaminohydrolase
MSGLGSSYVDAAHGGVGWIPRVLDAADGWGKSSEWAPLRRAILMMPREDGFSEVKDPGTVHWNELVDYGRLRDEIEGYATVLQDRGVRVELVAAPRYSLNIQFCRDLFTLTPHGAVISRMASQVRADEERVATSVLTSFGVPIQLSVLGDGVFEGPDLLNLGQGRYIIAESIRSNAAGVAQVRASLEALGAEVSSVETTYGCGHLDGVVSLVSERHAVVIPRRVSFALVSLLRRNGFKIIEADPQEADELMAVNMVVLEPSRVLIPEGCAVMIKRLAEHGIQAEPVPCREIMKGGGALHCVTGELLRA